MLDLDATPPELVESFDVVTARGFGPPSATLRIGVRLVRVGGLVLVSEPPQSVPGRWPVEELGLRGVDRVDHDDPAVAVFRRH